MNGQGIRLQDLGRIRQLMGAVRFRLNRFPVHPEGERVGKTARSHHPQPTLSRLLTRVDGDAKDQPIHSGFGCRLGIGFFLTLRLTPHDLGVQARRIEPGRPGGGQLPAPDRDLKLSARPSSQGKQGGQVRLGKSSGDGGNALERNRNEECQQDGRAAPGRAQHLRNLQTCIADVHLDPTPPRLRTLPDFSDSAGHESI